MSLALTPLNEAWNSMKVKSKPKVKNIQKVKPNVYNNPETQAKILTELGMMEREHDYETQEIEESKQVVVNKPNSLNINFTNTELINYLKPYSNDYIERIFLNCIQNKENTGITTELIDTIETMYLMISLLLLLFMIDIVFKIRKN